MKLFVFDHGIESINKSDFIADCDKGTIHNRNPKTTWIDIPLHSFLIEQEKGLILFDTGCDPNWQENWPEVLFEISPFTTTPQHMIHNRLSQLGYTPNDVNTVVLSHLHYDHAGGTDIFKNANIYVNEAEFRNTMSNFVLGEDLGFRLPTDINRMINAKLNWHLVPNSITQVMLTEGVKILNLGSGHAWGMLALDISLEKSGKKLLVSDAIYLEENIASGIKTPSVVYDTVGYVRTAKFLVEYAKENNAEILFGHDINTFNRLVKSDKGFYE